jgi:hypothetical protein
MDQAYLAPGEFDELYAMAQHAHAKIGGFIKYLIQSNVKRAVPGRRAGVTALGTRNAEPPTKNQEQ